MILSIRLGSKMYYKYLMIIIVYICGHQFLNIIYASFLFTIVEEVESYPDQEWRKSRWSLIAIFRAQAPLTLQALFHRP